MLISVVALTAALVSGGEATLMRRLQAWAGADLIVALCLALAIGHIARLRFSSPRDIAGNALTTPGERVRIGNAIVQNTLEQAGLAIPVYLALAMLRADARPLLIALAALFAAGRLLFALGYARGAAARSLGFALTFYPTLGGLALAAAALIAQ